MAVVPAIAFGYAMPLAIALLVVLFKD